MEISIPIETAGNISPQFLPIPLSHFFDGCWEISLTFSFRVSVGYDYEFVQKITLHLFLDFDSWLGPRNLHFNKPMLLVYDADFECCWDRCHLPDCGLTLAVLP